MKFPDWLDAETGRTKATAEHFSLSLSAITQWRNSIPPGRMRALHAFTKGAVSFEEMIPGDSVRWDGNERRTHVRRKSDRDLAAAALQPTQP